MQNYKMIIQYDGSRYDGWQKQGQAGSKEYDNTIQGKLENILARMTGAEIAVHGSGRTDSGVHSLAQVASFVLNIAKDPQEIQDYLNEYLPDDIAVVELTEAEPRFHARLNAKAKRYLYRIQNSNISNVFERKFMYQIPEELNIEAMEEAASYLMGEHDFKSFCSNKRMKKSSVREVYDIEINLDGEELDIIVYGNGFLHNMVRIIVGTLIEVGLEKRHPEEMVAILDAKDRYEAGFTAPARGLTLIDVEY